MDESNPELESFRQQWRAEVSARSKKEEPHIPSHAGSSSRLPRKLLAQSKATVKWAQADETEEDEVEEDARPSQSSATYTNEPPVDADNVEGYEKKTGSREPRSALEHYERAVEKESQGILGDSLNLYRTAFRVSTLLLEAPRSNSNFTDGRQSRPRI